MSPTPTSRTVAALKDQGWVPWNVEQWVPHTGKRLDFYGIADTFFVHPELLGMLVVQSTSDAGMSARTKKLEASPMTAILWKCGVGVELWGWIKFRGLWHPRIRRFSVDRRGAIVYAIDDEALYDHPRRREPGEARRGDDAPH